MANTTYTLPANLGDILGAHHDGNFQTVTQEIKAGIGVLARGTILASGTGADIGKLVKLSATTEANAYGILLDPQVDTAVAFGDGSVTGSIAKAGSFRGPALIVPTGVDAGLIAVALRGRAFSWRAQFPFRLLWRVLRPNPNANPSASAGPPSEISRQHP